MDTSSLLVIFPWMGKGLSKLCEDFMGTILCLLFFLNSCVHVHVCVCVCEHACLCVVHTCGCLGVAHM